MAANHVGGAFAQAASFACAERHSAPASIAWLIQMNISLSSRNGSLCGGSAGQVWVNVGGGVRLTRMGFVGGAHPIRGQAAKESTSGISMETGIGARRAGDGNLLGIGFLL